MKFLAAVALLLALAAAGTLAYAYGGGWDVAAVDPEPGCVDRALAAVSGRSVARHAAGIRVPPLGDPAMLRLGAARYGALCAACHGGPGVKPSAVGMGLNPGPPDLVDSARQMPAREVYWIVKHGIRMSGMPAFGPTHGERELWSIVAFVERLPRMSPEAYEEETRARPPARPIG